MDAERFFVGPPPLFQVVQPHDPEVLLRLALIEPVHRRGGSPLPLVVAEMLTPDDVGLVAGCVRLGGRYQEAMVLHADPPHMLPRLVDAIPTFFACIDHTQVVGVVDAIMD